MKNLLAIALHPRIYMLGRSEAFASYGMTYGHPESMKSIAYDMGRNHGEAD
jgi:hypothetical protein